MTCVRAGIESNQEWDMDLEAVLSVVKTWPADIRRRLVEEVRDGLEAESDEPELTEELKAKLDRRLAALDANPRDVTTWEAIAEYVRRPR